MPGLRIDTGRLAAGGAKPAAHTAILTDARPEQGDMAQTAQEGPHRAQGIAPGTTAPPGQESDKAKGEPGAQQRGQALLDQRDRSDGRAPERLFRQRQTVVDQHGQRLEKIRGHPAKGTIGIQYPGQTGQAQPQSGGKEDEGRQTQPWPVGPEGLAPPAATATPDKILKDTQGTDHGAVDAPQDKGQDDQGKHRQHGTRHEGRDQLHLAEPDQISRPEAVDIQEQHKKAQQAAYFKQDSQFSDHDALIVSGTAQQRAAPRPFRPGP